MKKSTLFFLVILSAFTVKAQSDQSDQSQKTGTSRSVYVEVLGSGLAVSANFDSRFSGSKGLGYRVGMGFVPLKGRTTLTFPFGINGIFGNGSSYFEAEGTATILTSSTGKFRGKDVSAVFIFPHIGYRYTKPSKSFLGRIYAGPMFFNGEVLPFLGLSLGYTF